ncbi:MAG: class I SAM-dependent rRNA methyltransferase [Pyrinomonadaceae bacterium]
MKQVTVNKRGADRIRHGHLWIYRSDLLEIETEGGTVVPVRDDGGNFVGQALYSSNSQIALRFLTQSDELINADWWRQRICKAAARRQHIASDTNAYRLVYSEGDLLPSLIIDRYDEVVVLQTLSQGTDALKQTFTQILHEEFAPQAIVERNDVRVRLLEGLPLTVSNLYGNPPSEIEIIQNGIRYVVTPSAGQKTGSFLDQRENRLAAKSVGHGRGLDCFTFNGGFALHLAEVCDSVTAVDISPEAIAQLKVNVELNRVTNIDLQEANVFDYLRELELGNERFDTIVLDPPAFAKNRKSLKAAMRGYKEINLRALKLLNPNGVLITCTCSYHMSEELFLDILATASIDAHRRIQLIEKRMQSSDHPVLVGVPETYYLKCVVCRVL